MKLISNEDLYVAARAYSQKFANMTPESYADFQHIIAGMSTSEARELLNEFTGTALAFYLNKVEGVKAKNPWDIKGLIEKFYVPFAGLKQNMYVRGRKPINPKFKNRQDGSSVDPFTFTKGSVEDIYFTFNDDYQNTISIPDFDIKTAVTTANGESSIIQGYMQFLEAMKIEWEKTHTAEVVNTMLNSVDHPLNSDQVVEIEFSDEVTRDELKELVATVNNVADAMELETTEAFNIAKFPKLVDKSELVMVMRPGIKNTIKTQLLESAFNKEELNMDIEQVIVPDFGGLVPTSDGTLANRLYMVYDSEGRPTDTYTTDEAGTTEYTGTVQWYDPNADVIGIIAEKGLIFIDEQNPYSVEGIHNPAGMYVTYWANKPNVGFHYDFYKNCVVIKKKAAEPVIKDYIKVENISPDPLVIDENTTGSYTVKVDTQAIGEDFGLGGATLTQKANFDTAEIEFDPRVLTTASGSEEQHVEISVDTAPSATENGTITIELKNSDNEVIETETINVTVAVSVPNSSVALMAGLPNSTRKTTSKKSSK